VGKTFFQVKSLLLVDSGGCFGKAHGVANENKGQLVMSTAEFREYHRRKMSPAHILMQAQKVRIHPDTQFQVNITKRPPTEVAKLNKTEKARLSLLEALKVPCLNVQAITLKLADDCRFTPDFSYVNENGKLTFEDVKGFQREDALIKIKVAARKFSEFSFVIVKKTASGWDVQEVKP
jgi:hypothetical protein